MKASLFDRDNPIQGKHYLQRLQIDAMRYHPHIILSPKATLLYKLTHRHYDTLCSINVVFGKIDFIWKTTRQLFGLSAGSSSTVSFPSSHTCSIAQKFSYYLRNCTGREVEAGKDNSLYRLEDKFSDHCCHPQSVSQFKKSVVWFAHCLLNFGEVEHFVQAA